MNYSSRGIRVKTTTGRVTSRAAAGDGLSVGPGSVPGRPYPQMTRDDRSDFPGREAKVGRDNKWSPIKFGEREKVSEILIVECVEDHNRDGDHFRMIFLVWYTILDRLIQMVLFLYKE